jgi:hypothetical protein
VDCQKPGEPWGSVHQRTGSLGRVSAGDQSPGFTGPRRQELLYKLQEEIMEHAPWVLVLNFKDIYALNNKVH